MKKFLVIEFLSTQSGWPNRGANIQEMENLPEIFTPHKGEELAVKIDQHGDIFVTSRVEGTMQEFCLYGIPEDASWDQEQDILNMAEDIAMCSLKYMRELTSPLVDELPEDVKGKARLIQTV